MRTLKGYEAIEVAHRFNVRLYDLEHRSDVTSEEARAYIDNRQDVSTFVLQNWPDTDDEAEQMVLKEFQRALREKRRFEMRMIDISNSMSGGLPIHLEAAEYAAKRLVKQHKLELVEENQAYSVYRLSRTIYFGDTFLDSLRSGLCDECAALDLEGPFHEACIIQLIEFLKEHDFTIDDMTEVHLQQTPVPKTRAASASVGASVGIGMEWLSKTASVTKLRLKNVLKPMLTPMDGEVDSSDGRVSASKSKPDAFDEPYEPGFARPVGAEFSEDSLSGNVGNMTKTRITKDELIRYLRDVEILDNNSELNQLKEERQKLLQSVSMKEQEMHKVERERLAVEKQCNEMQRDMDILIQAMRIAKRHDPSGSIVIDGSYKKD